MFKRTDTILDRILAKKVDEIAVLDASSLKRDALSAPPPRDFAGALHRETVALIAEVKHASPSKGVLIDPFDPVALASAYAENGAAAISVLTDQEFFQGNLADLRAVRSAVHVPLLRKDFTIDARQIYEARAAGADAILLITAALEDSQMSDLHAAAVDLGLAALVEVHDEAELDRALNIGAKLIGVNNRDLKTFREDVTTTERLAARVPVGITLVAESAIRAAADIRRMGACGASAVLIGEGLVKAHNIPATVREFSCQRRM